MKEKRHWWQRACAYQIYPKSFMDSNGDGIGDIPGIMEKLPYLKELGIEILWISPMYESPDVDNGYDVSNYRRLKREFGTDEEFDALVRKAHELGIRIMMDFVANHTSDQHPWFAESRSSRDNPYRDYYIWKDPVDGHEPNNWGSCFAGPAWKLDETTGQYYLHIFAAEQPDLNWENETVRGEIYDAMNWWLDRGVDGFRMDAIGLISKDQSFPDGKPGFNGYAAWNDPANGPRVHEFLREMSRKVLNAHEGRDIVTVGECTNVGPEEALNYAKLDGSELSMLFQFEHMDLDNDPQTGNKWTLRKMDLCELKDIFTRWETILHGKAWNSLFWQNHDQPRIVSRLGNDGEYREKSAKMLATCLHMMEGTPYIYQGEEIGMTNMHYSSEAQFRDLDAINGLRELREKKIMDPEEAWKAVCYKSRDNARHPMQWNGRANAGFTTGTPWIDVNPNYTKINVEDALSREDSIFYYYQKLIRLRKESDLIVYGEYRLLDRDNPAVWSYTRTLGEESLICVCNFTDRDAAAPLPKEYVKGKVLISNTDRLDLRDGEIRLAPYDAVVLLKKENSFSAPGNNN